MGCMSDLCIRHLLPIETMAEDVPLCSFDMIQKSLEQEIKKAEFEKSTKSALGYVLYCEPGAYHEWGQKADYSSIFYDVKADVASELLAGFQRTGGARRIL